VYEWEKRRNEAALTFTPNALARDLLYVIKQLQMPSMEAWREKKAK